MTMKTLRLALLCAPAALMACGGTNPKNDGGSPAVPAFRGLVADPTLLGFTCVTPGCDNTQTVKVRSTVNRRIAVKTIRLSSPNPEYTIIADQPTPFLLGAAADFRIDVRFAPVTAPRPEAIKVLVDYTDASGDESDTERIDPGELAIPLVKRLVGEARLSAAPPSVNFGVVAVSEFSEEPVRITNSGFGNISLALSPTDAGVRDLRVDVPGDVSLVPDAGVNVGFRFQPTVEKYLKTEVTVRSTTPGVDPLPVAVEGTSWSVPRVTVEPEELTLDLGEVPKGGTETVTLKVANVGGLPLNISSLTVTDPGPDGGSLGRVTATFPDDQTSATLQPLERIDLIVKVTGTTPGFFEGSIIIDSDDPVRNPFELPLKGTITEPNLVTNAPDGGIDWGDVPQGWVVSKTLELRNAGYGAVTVSNITFAGGSSTLLALNNLPSLPLTLNREERAAFDIEFSARAMVSSLPSLSIRVEEPVPHNVNVPLKAVVKTCEQACQIVHGTPDCNSQTHSCGIASCDASWYDNDDEPSTGCECRELDPSGDPGGFCGQARSKGTLSDTGSSASHTGIIHASYDSVGTRTDDVDYIAFFGEDSSSGQLFGDDYDVRINLSTTDPGIFMCITRYETPTAAFGEGCTTNEQCGLRTYRKEGSYGTEDGAMYYIKVYRTASSAPTCNQYTVTMQNN